MKKHLNAKPTLKMQLATLQERFLFLEKAFTVKSDILSRTENALIKERQDLTKRLREYEQEVQFMRQALQHALPTRGH